MILGLRPLSLPDSLEVAVMTALIEHPLSSPKAQPKKHHLKRN